MLKPIRIFDPEHIPEYLVEQIKDREFTVQAFYEYQRAICTSLENGQRVLNPYNLLYVLADEEKRVEGFIWAVVDILNGILCINNFSINRKYWGKGTALEILKEWALNIKNGAQLKKIYWITKKTKYCEKHGFRESKNVLHEYAEEEDNGFVNDKWGPSEGNRPEPAFNPSAAELPITDHGRSGGTGSGCAGQLDAAV